VTRPTHRTAAGVLVVDGRVLLERRRTDAHVYPDYWDIPGGHLQPGEAPAQALVREMQEEIGISIDDCFLGVVQEDRDHERTAGRVYRHYVYVVNRFRGVPEARERQRLQWWPLDAALTADTLNPLAAEALRGFVAAGWV
jgi:mutator protein MutT